MATPKVYNGSSWVTFVTKVWDGSAWVGGAKFWNGTEWVPLEVSVYTEDVSRHRSSSGDDDAVATVRVDTDGTIKTAAQTHAAPLEGEYSTEYTWLLSGNAADYQYRVTVTSGPTQQGTAIVTGGGSFGTWHTLNANYAFSLKDDSSTSFGNTTTATFLIEFRKVSGGAAIASFNANLSARCFT